MATIRPKTGTDKFRLISLAIGPGVLIEPDELHGTRDQKRLFLANADGSADEIIAPFDHGEIASEAAMLALNETTADERGCHRGDFCERTDINCLVVCKSNRGESLSDWHFFPLREGTTGGYGTTWGFVIQDDELCIEFDEDGNPFIAIEEIT